MKYHIDQISSISTYEYIQLVGHYLRTLAKSEINSTIYSRGYSKETIEMLEKQLEKKVSGQSNQLLNLKFKGSLKKYVYPYFDFVLSSFMAFKEHGVLPFEGAYSDQPAQIIHIFDVFQAIKNEYESRAMEQHKREQDINKKKQDKRK